MGASSRPTAGRGRAVWPAVGPLVVATETAAGPPRGPPRTPAASCRPTGPAGAPLADQRARRKWRPKETGPQTVGRPAGWGRRGDPLGAVWAFWGRARAARLHVGGQFPGWNCLNFGISEFWEFWIEVNRFRRYLNDQSPIDDNAWEIMEVSVGSCCFSDSLPTSRFGENNTRPFSELRPS